MSEKAHPRTVMSRFDRLLQMMAGVAGQKSEEAPQSSNVEPSRGYDEIDEAMV
jgi:hypothetical protein